MDPIKQRLVQVEVNEASREMYLLAHSLETVAEYGVAGARGVLKRRAKKLREIADALTEGVAEAWATD